MKRVADEIFEFASYDGVHGLQVAKLVCIHGFLCVNDMRMMSTCLNRAFWEWCRKYVYDRGITVWSSASTIEQECFHRSFLGVDLLRHEILKIRPEQWFHLYHVTLTFDAEYWRTASILQLACTSISSEPFGLHSLASLLISGGKCNKELQKPEGFPHTIKVEHHHQPGRFRFYICMKWT